MPFFSVQKMLTRFEIQTRDIICIHPTKKASAQVVLNVVNYTVTPDNSNLLAGVLGKSIHHLSTQTYLALVKIPQSCYFIPRILASQPYKYRKSCSHLSLNSLFPLLFLACISSITTKNSQTLHPVKPTVDPQLLGVGVIHV